MKLVREISKFIKKENKFNRVSITEKVLCNIQHEWIVTDRYIFRSFKFLLEAIPEDKKEFFMKNNILFLPSDGKLACALSQLQNCHTIIIFPDLMKILKSPIFERGIAVLAHELGHIYYEHSYKNIHPAKAQLEADSFVEDMGLKDSLIQILSDYENQASSERLAKLKGN